MRVEFLQLFHRHAKQCIIFLRVTIFLTGFTGLAFAKTSVVAPLPSKALTDLVITDDKGSELQLEVRQMPFAQVLDSIARQTQVSIHYSVLPEGMVTATCVGTTLKQILECLLDRKADLIVRYSDELAQAGGNEKIAEAWVLGSRLDGNPDSRANCLATEKEAGKASLLLKQKEQTIEEEPDQTEELIKMAQSKNPSDRAEAIGALMAGGRKDDPQVKAVLLEALTDKDANVRAQAISTLAHREGSGARTAIQEALHDSSVDVRIMAVDGITDDAAMLQQAVNDSDETVRSLATTKLESLTQKNKGQP